MAEKYLKLMQDGRVSYAPDNKQTRAFWANYNKRVGGGKNSSQEIVTYGPATEEEVAFMTNPVSETAAFLQKQQNVEAATAEQLAQMRQMIESQQALINKLLLDKLTTEANEVTEEPEKVKGKPGPKPKTETDGKDKQASTEAQA